MATKTNKSFTKRFRVTRRGKVVRKTINQSHYRAKKSSKVIRGLRLEKTVAKADIKNIRMHMPFN